MKRISFWARNHKWPARIIIVVSFILLNVLGIFTGIFLDKLGISISSTTLLVFVSVFLVGFAFYPSKAAKNKKNATIFYINQKSYDFILAASTFCMIVYIGNKPETLFQQYQPLNATVMTEPYLLKDSSSKNYKSISDFNKTMKDENGKILKWKERKKLLKA